MVRPRCLNYWSPRGLGLIFNGASASLMTLLSTLAQNVRSTRAYSLLGSLLVNQLDFSFFGGDNHLDPLTKE